VGANLSALKYEDKNLRDNFPVPNAALIICFWSH